MLFACINCHQPYEETDVEAYLCSPCLEQKKIIAAEIDKKRENQPRIKVKTELELYDEAKKLRGGFPSYKSFMH